MRRFTINTTLNQISGKSTLYLRSQRLSAVPALRLGAAVLLAPILLSNMAVAANELPRAVNANSSHTGYQSFDAPPQYAFNSTYEDPNFTLPELGSGGTRFIEANQHKALGEWSLQQLAKNAPMLNDPWVQEQLDIMAWQINAQARNQAPLALLVINNPTINAFAIPGGVMGIHTGTIIESNSMDELASVVAHEVAHLSQRHYEHRDETNRKALLMQIGGLLAAIAASAADPNAATAVMMGSQTAALNSQMAFSRSNEREADRIGMQLMAKAGYDPRAMPRFFGTLNQKTQLNTTQNAYLPSFIMTHPLSAERLSEAQSRANSYAEVGLTEQRSPLTFDLLKWRVKVLTNRVTEGELLAASKTNKGAAIAMAYWYGTQGRYKEASDLFNQLKSKENSQLRAYSTADARDKVTLDILLAITEGQVAGMQGKWQYTQQLLLPYYNLYPDRRDIKLMLTEAWLQLGKYNEVISALKPIVSNKRHDLESLYRLQRAYELMAQQSLMSTNSANLNNGNQNNGNQNNGNQDNGNQNIITQNVPVIRSNQPLANISAVNALRYRAQGELWRGQYNDALVSLQQAKTLIETQQPNSASTNTYNLAPLLANINSEIADVKIARDFSP